jgi:hypothetical protein
MFGGHVFQQSAYLWIQTVLTSSRQIVALLVRGRLHTDAFQEKQKEACPILLISHSAI